MIKMKEYLPAVIDSTALQNQVDQFSEQLSNYLGYLELPADKVLVELSERRVIINNMPSLGALALLYPLYPEASFSRA